MDDFKQQNWGGMNNAGSGQDQGGSSIPPPPPPPEITLRTMQSDLESVKQSGGENPTPQAFTPPEIKKQPSVELNDLSQEDGMIRPSASDGVLPPSETPKKKGKVFLLVTILVLVLAGAAYAGYVYIYPMFAKPVISNTPVPPANIPETPSTSITFPPENQEPIIPPLEETATTTEEELASTTPETPPLVVLKPHTSLLSANPADIMLNLHIGETVTLTLLRDALVAEAGNKPTAETSLKEVSLSNESGQLVFSDTLALLLPELTSAELTPLFQEDFTSVIFYDKDGAWFGLIAQLNDGADVASAKTLMARLESSTGLANLYLQNPGAKSGTSFKDGKANNLTTRYVSFSTTGASLNYGWTSDNLFVLSTSYNGIKAMLTKLGVQ